jgi:type I restriction-modification system DNA methylase subunit
MTGQSVMNALGFDRVIPLNALGENPSGSESVVLEQISKFGVDSVYLNTDENGNSFPAVFLKKVDTFDQETLLDIAEIQRNIWNYKKVLFLYVYNEVEIRIYNCAERPLLKTKHNFDCEKELKSLEIENYRFSDKDKLRQLHDLFSRTALDSGTIWTHEDAHAITVKIKLQKRVDKYLVESLVNTAVELEKQGLEINFIHKIMLRSLFLLYLEDRGATDATFYAQIKSGTKSYFDILDDPKATRNLYERLEEYFNGNVFTLEADETVSKEQLQLVKQCFISGNDGLGQVSLFQDWRLFDFSIIQIELLSEIYENFLFKTDPVLKKATGTYYTPPALVEFILNEQLPTHKTDTNYHVRVLDPSCGSGIFLVESFNRLVKRYENNHQVKLTDFDKLKQLLTENIFGVEIHPQAIKVAAFSLYLALVDKLDPKNLWQKEKHRLPNLIHNPKDKSLRTQGKNLFCRDTLLQNDDIEGLEFDLVVGNPPFGTTNLSNTVRDYCEQHDFAKEMVLPFLHKATKFAPNGTIALIFNTKVLTNTGSGYQNFREWLFNDCYVERVFNFSILRNAHEDFGGQLFGDATGPISIVFYQKEQPGEPSDKIVYYAPKTFIKTNVIDGLCIDFTDLKYLPRTECQKPDTKIWKVAMWGGLNDWNLVKKLNNPGVQTIESFAKDHDIKSGVGFQLLTQKKDQPRYSETLTALPYLEADMITQYYTPERCLKNVTQSVKSPKAIKFYIAFYGLKNIFQLEKLTAFRRLGDIDAFTEPHIVLKKGLERNSICASLVDTKCSFRDGVYGFYTNNNDIEALYLLVGYFNSVLSTYYLFMTISSYGIEREQIMKNEYLSIPINLNNEQRQIIIDESKCIIQKLKSEVFSMNFFEQKGLEEYIKETIDKVIFESLGLSSREIATVNDAIKYNVDLFHKKKKSIALHPTPHSQVADYGKALCAELNEFLGEQSMFVNATIYSISKFTPLMMVKLSFTDIKQDIFLSEELVDTELKKIDQHLWTEKSSNIYFRKKLNYKKGNDIFIIRPNQRRFWSQSMAQEDASELILEILTGN